MNDKGHQMQIAIIIDSLRNLKNFVLENTVGVPVCVKTRRCITGNTQRYNSWRHLRSAKLRAIGDGFGDCEQRLSKVNRWRLIVVPCLVLFLVKRASRNRRVLPDSVRLTEATQSIPRCSLGSLKGFNLLGVYDSFNKKQKYIN